MAHTYEHLVAFFKKSGASYRVENRSKAVSAGQVAIEDNSKDSQEPDYEPIEIQLASFQYVGNIFKR